MAAPPAALFWKIRRATGTMYRLAGEKERRFTTLYCTCSTQNLAEALAMAVTAEEPLTANWKARVGARCESLKKMDIGDDSAIITPAENAGKSRCWSTATT